ncbi:hypothetical protein K9L05_02445 [Candidatus Babeliales bacterium]|nr:hypothetical protein [Candidatus Babeliales bacterium]MCF7899485.1 hypothetical protein [Candidatus Babeliales bacterium]
MEEKYILWNPSPIITDDYVVKTITYGTDGTIVILESRIDSKKNLIRLKFGAAADSYMVSDKNFRQGLYKKLKNIFFDEKDYLKYGGRFLVENSKFIKWLIEISGYLECFELKHFILINENAVFDIVSRIDPCIEVIKVN